MLRFFMSLLLLAICTNAVAKSTAKMDVKRQPYKLTQVDKKQGFPKNGPIIKVYSEGSSSTKYSHVANTHKKLPFMVKYTATCFNKGSQSGANLSSDQVTMSLNAKGGFASDVVYFKKPYNDIANVQPLKVCNDHAKTLSLWK